MDHRVRDGAVWISRILLGCSVSLSASAQVPHLQLKGPDSLWELTGVCPVGDLDQDGVTDLVLGADKAGLQNDGGEVHVVSGATGATLLGPHYGPRDATWGHFVAGIDDFDGDGIEDFAAGIPDEGPGSFHGEVRVWSGATGQEIVLIPHPYGFDNLFGYELFPLGDVDQDGYSEFGVNFFDGPEDFLIYGGPDGSLDRVHPEAGSPGGFGIGRPSGASIGDVDADGVPDYVVGWRQGEGFGPNGLVVLFSGKTGQEILRNIGGGYEGAALAPMGDLDGDGTPDFASGAPWSSQYICPGNDYPGNVRLRSGKDLSLLGIIDGPREYFPAHGCTFYQLDGGEDVNGDGVCDLMSFAAGAYPHNDPKWGHDVRGTLSIHSGRTGTLLWRMLGDGWNSSLVGDLDGDGLSEWAWGNDLHSKPLYKQGKVTVYLGWPGDAERVCTAGQNSTGNAARLSFEGPIGIRNNHLSLVIEGGVPDASGAFFYGPELVMRPFGDGTLCAGGGTIGRQRIGTPVKLDQDGFVMQPVDMNAPPMGGGGPASWTVGSTWVVQFVYRDRDSTGAGFNLSDAMLVTWLP